MLTWLSASSRAERQSLMSNAGLIHSDGVIWVPVVGEYTTTLYQGQKCRWISDGVIRTEKPLIVVDISRSKQGEDYLYVVDENGCHTGIPISEAYTIYTGDNIR